MNWLLRVIPQPSQAVIVFLELGTMFSAFPSIISLSLTCKHDFSGMPSGEFFSSLAQTFKGEGHYGGKGFHYICLLGFKGGLVRLD